MKRVVVMVMLALFVLAPVFAATDSGDDSQTVRTTRYADYEAVVSTYRDDIQLLRDEYRDDRQALSTQAEALISDVRENPDLTEEERMELRSDLAELRRDAWNLRDSYVDDSREIRVSFHEDIRSLRQNDLGEFVHRMRDGRDFPIDTMPDVASDRAIERLRLKKCDDTNDCSLELREVGEGAEARVRYALQAKKEARMFGLWRTHMDVEAEVDPETGEVVRTRKPWWAFLASEN